MTKTLIRLILSFLLLIFIWFIGPYVSIGNIKPLANVWEQLGASILLVGAWGIYGIQSLYRRRHATLTLNANDLTQTFDRALRDAYRFLKKQHGWKRCFVQPQQPWVLLLGPSGSGKTTLLKHSGLSLTSPAQQTLETVKPTQTLAFWQSENAVFVDPPGDSILPQTTNPHITQAWHQLLQSMRRYHAPNPFNAVLMVLDVNTLLTMTEQALHPLTQQLCHQLQVLCHTHQYVPVTLLITQSDRIQGFNDFFSHLPTQERTQPLGFELNIEKNGASPASRIETGLTKLLEQVNAWLLWRLHHEQNIVKRGRIKDFPLQLEQFFQRINRLVSQLPTHPALHLSGVFLTSAEQTPNPNDLLAQSLVDAFDVKSEPALSPFHTRSNACFIQALFANLQFQHTKPAQRAWPRLLSLLLAGGLIIGITTYWHINYQTHLGMMQRIAAQLNQRDTQAPAWLARLNALSGVIQTVRTTPTDETIWSHISKPKTIERTAQTAYEQTLRSTLPTILATIAADDVRANLSNQPLKLYDALKRYLILTDNQRTDKTALVAWFATYWQKKFPHNPARQQQLKQHLLNLFQQKNIPWQRDTQLIQTAQKILKQLPPAEIAFLQLQNDYALTPTPIIKNPSVLPGIDVTQLTVPDFYSMDNFKVLYNEKIPALAKRVLQGNWVLGQSNTTIAPDAQQAFITALQVRYMKGFEKAWQNLLPKIHIQPASTLADVQARLALLTTQNSPLRQLITLICTNAGETSPFSDKSASNQALLNNLGKLDAQLSTISKSQTPNKASFDFTAKRFTEADPNDALSALQHVKTKTNPALKSWAQALAQNSWSLLLKNTRDFIASNWAMQITPFYQKNIENRFPVFTQANEEISLKAFMRFFGPSGLLNQFFDANLKAFVDTQKEYWSYKQKDGQTIGFSRDFLDQLIRASLIQRMFFSDTQVSMQIQFMLKPIRFSEDIAKVTLTVDGQTAQFSGPASAGVAMTWPGPTPGEASVQFESLLGQTQHATQRGVWAWLRLIQSAQLTPSNNPKQFTLTLHAQKRSATFKLTADNVVNPYLPNLLTKFRATLSTQKKSAAEN